MVDAQRMVALDAALDHGNRGGLNLTPLRHQQLDTHVAHQLHVGRAPLCPLAGALHERSTHTAFCGIAVAGLAVAGVAAAGWAAATGLAVVVRLWLRDWRERQICGGGIGGGDGIGSGGGIGGSGVGGGGGGEIGSGGKRVSPGRKARACACRPTTAAPMYAGPPQQHRASYRPVTVPLEQQCAALRTTRASPYRPLTRSQWHCRAQPCVWMV
eukprot:351328-Chlamydomonas_euryale.AAC.1